MLLDRVRTTAVPFERSLVGLQGDSVKWSREHALPRLMEEVSFTILRNKGISSVFGIDKPPVTEWPYVEDSNGDKLVEVISKQLMWTDKPDELCITREYFSNLQRVALRGAEAIATIIDFRDTVTDTDLELLIKKVYTWGAALMSLNAHAKPSQPTS